MTDKPETPMIYRTFAQTESITITAETKGAVTMARAEIDVEDHVLPKHIQSDLKPWVTLPIATQESWDRGYVNFCPRCGKRIEDTDDNNWLGDCFECGAELDIQITIPEFYSEDESEEDNE